MYEIATKAEDFLIMLVLASFFCLIGQIVGVLLPENLIIPIVFVLSCFLGFACCIYRMIYRTGMEAARKEQEPDEDNSHDSTT